MLQPQSLSLPPNISLGFSNRQGGVSPEPFRSLNMSVARGDMAENVSQNRNLFLNKLGITENHLAQPLQVSRDGVRLVDSPGKYENLDALLTVTPGLFLSVLTADCSPILVWSDEKSLVAAVHSGWQGSELNILGQTLEAIIGILKINPSSLYVAIGPGLSQDNFEVGPEFVDKFSTPYLRPLHHSDRYHFDNNQFLVDTAIESGVPVEQIEVLPFCTYRDEELFFSHRRDGLKTGRMMSVIGIKK
ncbi:MAG: peptidoglycan editing factor PgeF [Candidatus Marinimicrobia bacterium]|nr:peptidoglycan editing factor PgeF [Candidatus Neomarinimicrobiota bacterium]